MKNKNKIILFLTYVVLNFLIIDKVSAASATFKVSSSASTVAVGNNFNVTVTLSSSSPLGGWDFIIGYDTSKLKLISSTANGDQRSVDVGDGSQKSVSYKYTFKALKSGTANVYIQSASVYDFDYQSMSLNKGSVNINLKTWEQIEASYSTNANLKSISIDGGELNPKFDKDTLEYTIELEPDTTEITVNATKEDNTASISGIGKINVSEGSNKIEIVVTAQKGNTKKYTINAIVKELEPIIVEVDNNKYSVVRKIDNLEKTYAYEENTAMINEIEVPAFYSSITGYKLVGLKDEEGNIKLFIYDENNGSFKYYQSLSLNKIVLSVLSIPEDKIIKGYEKCFLTINSENVEGITNKELGINLVYGKNVENGKTSFYVYDKEENTIQRYDENIFNNINKKIELYSYIILGMGGIVVLLIIILIAVISNNKKKLNERKEEMHQELIDNEEMAKIDELNKKEKKKMEKELKQKEKELEELEKKSREKIEKQEQIESNGKELSKKEKKKQKKNKKNEETNQNLDDSSLQQFELETKNDNSKEEEKKKNNNDDDDMFLL